ncbi:NB-ARC domain-containing protein [Pseudomonas azerbaijanorientalis]|uniref:NB-ARC domain-containing protein n=1 Tax=Pseudomonas azerbaijanorientalis TaxID=2842350 RepID=UPI001C3CAC5E|nr:NB-ARC domain-containing protein [Pseudomonas azerbaijanorientalis]QXH63800.1 hypothetical protein KSS91_10075 [Pseudomonas azerbaijanorientalis]
MTNNLNRRKAAMVLHDMEQALGSYVLDSELDVSRFPEQLIQDIADRERDSKRVFDATKVKDVIEATYLDELFQILIELTKDTSANNYLIALRELFVKFEVYEIRNSVSHPNRRFIDPYWYRLAAVASDPIIDILGMESVHRSLVSAEKGEITDPPEEWLSRSIWQIKNNMPDRFDHAITGLVGRQKEGGELLKLLKNPRVNTVAIVGPGGLGKTALALDLLDKLVKLPETSEWCDCCIFVSMKTEMLTSEGLKKLDAVETIDDIKTNILEELNEIFEVDCTTFEEALSAFEAHKIVLFIDNLETLLIDHPKEFEDLNYSLPQSWRLLVTSRISINNASIISLEALKPKSASLLARMYSSRRGGGNIPEPKLDEIATKCHCNPLAIRLTLDLYIAGKDIPQSINVANKEIADFSYNNLIESLSQTSIKILEALFVAGKSDRSDLCELLELSRDELASAISELSNTSLLTRDITDDGEVFRLSGSITDLLLTNAKNINTRREIQILVSRRKAQAREIDARQAHQRIPAHRWDFIPTTLHQSLKILLTELNRSMQKFYLKPERAILLSKKFAEADHLYNGFAIFNRGYGKVYESLNAKDLAKIRYEKAIEQDAQDPNNKLFLAMLYHSIGEYEDSRDVYNELIAEGWAEEKESDVSVASEIVNGRFLTLLYDHKHDRLIEETTEWKTQGKLRGLYGAFRASALKRQAEGFANDDPKVTSQTLQRAIKILDDVFRNDGYTKSICLLAKNIFNELAFLLDRKEYKNDSAFATATLDFISKHLINSTEYVKYREGDYVYLLVRNLSKLNLPNNPFKDNSWTQIASISSDDDLHEVEAQDKDLTITTVTRLPKGRAGGVNTFLFAVCEKKLEYFVHFDNLSNGDFQSWRKVKIGTRLGVKAAPDNIQEKGRAVKVSEAHILS